MKKVLFAQIPILLLLAACQVGASYGPAPLATPQPTPIATPFTEPSGISTPAPSLSPLPSTSPTPTPSPRATDAPVIGQAVSFSVLLDRDTSVDVESTSMEFSDQASFTQFWAKHANTLRGGSIRLEQPNIDFAKNTVLAVHQSQARTAGLGYEISAVYRDGRTVRAHYRQRTAQKGMGYAAVISSTIHAVSIPLSKANGDYDNVLFILDAPQPTEAGS